jgi:hypothetical protein
MSTKRAGINTLYLTATGLSGDDSLRFHKIRKPSTLKISEINTQKDYMGRELHNMMKFSMEAQSQHVGYYGIALALAAAKDGAVCEVKLDGDSGIFKFPDPTGCDVEIDITEKEAAIKYLIDRAYMIEDGKAQITAMSTNALTYPTPSNNKVAPSNTLGQLVAIKTGTSAAGAVDLITRESLESFKLSMKSKSNKTMFENRIPYMVEISAEIAHHGNDIVTTKDGYAIDYASNGFLFQFQYGSSQVCKIWFAPSTLAVTSESEIGDEKRNNKIKLSGGILLSETAYNGSDLITLG